jgi:ADP-ribose pyrophosphatase
MNNNKPQANLIGWNLLGHQYLFQSQWFNLRQDKIQVFNDKEFTYTYVEHPGAVFIVPITENLEVILIHSYRYPIDRWCWEIPAGSLGDQDKLSPSDVEHKELAEEIGGETENLKSLGSYYMANGFASLENHFFIAYDTKIRFTHQKEDTEVISEIKVLPIKQALQMIQNGEINDGESAFAMLLAFMEMRSVFRLTEK